MPRIWPVKSNPSHRTLTIGEFFAGPGGMALGARWAAETHGLLPTHLFAVEKNPDACATYARNILGREESLAPCAIEQVDMAALPSVDLFLFGFPCNDFSMVGKAMGLDGDYGPLFRFGVRYLDAAGPESFVAENVPGLAHSVAGATSAIETILDELADAGPGYDVVPHLYRLEEYGVPQTRHRIFIVGTRKDLRIRFRPPAPTAEDPGTWTTCREAIESPPIGPGTANAEPMKVEPATIDRLRHILPGQNVWDAQRKGQVPDHLRIREPGAAMSGIYRRLDPDLPAYTITSGGGGGTYGYHWSEPRPLTNRERARLQTFPDDHVFDGSQASVRRQIGMAVPPKAAAIVMGALLEDLKGERTTPRCAPNLMPRTAADAPARRSRSKRDDVRGLAARP